eukprot:Nitzschia sp. Nitz4//scaffold42_size132992//119267//129070//NITZ4_003422-RA/size132992-processed-gene-0.49-mRNA-1//-1//CDS//3329551787//2698//frame0
MVNVFAPKKASGTSKDVLHEVESFGHDFLNEKDNMRRQISEFSITSQEDRDVAIGVVENSRVSCTRIIMLIVLVTLATTLSIVVYHSSNKSEQNAFEYGFEVVADKLTKEFEGGAIRRLSAVESFATQISSYAQATNASWPNVALPDFERQGHYINDLADMLALVLIPIVTKENRESYEQFAVENQGWIQEGLELQGIPEEDWDHESMAIVESVLGHSPNMTIPEKIFALNGTEAVEETGDGPFAPFWQLCPAVPSVNIVNYNTFTHGTRKTPVRTAIDHGKTMIAESWDYSEYENSATVGRRAMLNLWIHHSGHNVSTYVNGPVTDLYIPIYDTYDENATLVALLSSNIYWQVYFEDVLSDNDKGICVILENTCGQAYSFHIHGSHARYMGQGDLHETKYSHMGVETEFGSFSSYEYSEDILDDIPDGQCLYRISVYPSDEFAGQFLTSAPRRFALILACTFALTCLVFLLYDKFVEVRQRAVMKSAIMSGTVVNSLFPEEVRNRLYNKQDSSGGGGTDSNKVRAAVGFLNPGNNNQAINKFPDLETDRMAIADLYPDCTVCFLDVVGFTQWSSGREPSHVFKLLETLYKSFDKSAKRLGVFKVETVGDCYVSVTGLPRPQKDHALLMAQFAADCCLKIGSVTHYLADQLGPNTLNLCLRGGMHSGPVTAGVLRGAKARFQLFGDTVNTAARMESTGMRCKVQLSQETGALLTEAGKKEWIVPREDEVQAKGKGSLRTYWLELNRNPLYKDLGCCWSCQYKNMASRNLPMEDEPESVEEAGALLGASINRYGIPGNLHYINPPKGIHSSFAALAPVPASELFVRLHTLRSLLRSAPRDTPLVAAPSLLAGALMKLLGISSNLATATGTHADPTARSATPPLLSTPLRKLWVDCVVLCHVLGEGLSGHSRINIFGFVKQMIQLAAMNPRAARAAGGNRIAALEVICALMKEESLCKQLSSWALDVIQLCQKALKSSGNGEPSYRIAAVQTAIAAAISSREAFASTRPGVHPLVLKGALEDKAILEMVKLLKTAGTDKFPEVRAAATTLATVLAPLVLHTSIKSPNTPDAAASSPTAGLDEIMLIAFKNLDDASAVVSSGWAQALAYCMTTAIEYHTQQTAEKSSNRNVEDAMPPPDVGGSSRGGRKSVLSSGTCTTLPKAMKALVHFFIKLGGELSASKLGGTFSVGGRAVRNAISRTMVYLLRLQTTLGAIGEGKNISHKEAIEIILTLVGHDLDSQMGGSFGPPTANNLFGNSPKHSTTDPNLARHAAARVLREGIVEVASESTQITIMYDLIRLCGKERGALRGNQVQVAFIEISNILAVLGEAATSALEDLVPALSTCLRDTDQGVRHEAAIACASMTTVSPVVGQKLIRTCIDEIQLEHVEFLSTSSRPISEGAKDSGGAISGPFGRFRRQSPQTKVDPSAKHKHAIHGLAFAISIALRDLPRLPDGLPTELMDMALSVAEILVNTPFRDSVASNNPGGVCTCVRAGFGIVCGALSTGADAVTKHVDLIFNLWEKITKQIKRGGNFMPVHELVCTDAMLQSVSVFLRYCSSLLLTVPEALSKISLLLEEVLPQLFDNGRLGQTRNVAVAIPYLDLARGAILEAFAWLPPGSYPMIADSVFSFSAGNLQAAIEQEISCSLLRGLVSREDNILDATNGSRAVSVGQVGGSKDIDNDIVALTCEPASHLDREACIYSQKPAYDTQSSLSIFLESEALGLVAADTPKEKAPTALHEVGTWRRPAIPSCSAKVRLVDSSIQAFAATFTLKSSRDQQSALQILESLLPPTHIHNQRSEARRGKAKEEAAAAINVAAVLLCCLRALPILESTHNIPVNLGPSWMSKAKDVFLQILPSQSTEVRRAAAEGLGFLSTLGVREDARFLQSAVLHSLDEVMQGTQSQEAGKVLSLEAVSAGRSAAALALACMQRTAFRIGKERDRRARERGGSKPKAADDFLPLFQILIKILPTIAIRSSGGFLDVRAFGLHALGLLISYSNSPNLESMSEQDHHLMLKIVELIEDNFLSAWTAASADYDHGTDAVKLSSEAPFVAVLLRMMTFVLPFLGHIEKADGYVASRFSRMATVAMDCAGCHPVVKAEVLAFYEVLTEHRYLLPVGGGGIKYDEHSVLCCLPMLMESIQPRRLPVHAVESSCPNGYASSSHTVLRAALKVVRRLSSAGVLVAEWSDLTMVALLYAALDEFVATQVFNGTMTSRNLAAPRETEPVYGISDSIVMDLSDVMLGCVLQERQLSQRYLPVLLRYMLLARCVLIGTGAPEDDDDDDDDESRPVLTVAEVVRAAMRNASMDAAPVLGASKAVHWQTKALAVKIMAVALDETAKTQRDAVLSETSVFNPSIAQQECKEACQQAANSGGPIPEPILSLHLGAVVTSACVTATATVDQAELLGLQWCAMGLLKSIIKYFGSIPDVEQPGTTILHDYIPQVSSAIKNALSAPNESSGISAGQLFLSGCETLKVFMKESVTSDIAVLKRMARPAVPTREHVSFFKMDGTAPQLENPSELLVDVGRLWTVGNIYSDVSDLMGIIEADNLSVGCNAAAMAIDGASILLSSGLSLCGSKTKSCPDMTHIRAGIFVSDISELEGSLKLALAQRSASLGSTAVSLLATSLSSGPKADVEVWLKALVPFLFNGFRTFALSRQEDKETVGWDDASWYSSLNKDDMACSCLGGIASIASTRELLAIDPTWKTEIESAILLIFTHIFDPVVTGISHSDISTEVLGATCSQLQRIFVCELFEVTEKSAVTLAILRTLQVIEEGRLQRSDATIDTIYSVCLTLLAGIIQRGSDTGALAKVTVASVLKVSATNKNVTSSVKTGIRALFKVCVGLDTLSIDDRSKMAECAVSCHDWETWSAVVKVEDGKFAKNSLNVFGKVLQNYEEPVQQVAAMATLRALLQESPPPNPLTGRFVCYLLVDVLSLFHKFGTLDAAGAPKQHRTEVCSDGMKIALVALQQFVADGLSDEDMSKFLLGLFGSFIGVIRFNGLPNHPSPRPGDSDPLIGRMCAQAITHIARVTPVAFKASMAQMGEQERAILELAVRAEMSGYAAAPAPAKKKLNLKSFTK